MLPHQSPTNPSRTRTQNQNHNDDPATVSPFSGACAKCANRKQCKRPCPFVEAILSEDNPKALEKNVGSNVRVLFPHRLEIRTSEYSSDDGDDTPLQERIFSDENKAYWDELTAEADLLNMRQMQLRVFYEIFFHGANWDDVATMLDMPVNSVKAAYGRAKQRLITVSQAVDKQEFAKIHAQKSLDRFPRWLQVYLLYTVFDMREREIILFLGATQSAVKGAYQKARRYVAEGKVNLLDIIQPAGKTNPRKTGAGYYRAAMDMILSGRVLTRRDACKIIADRDGCDVELIEGRINGYITRGAARTDEDG